MPLPGPDSRARAERPQWTHFQGPHCPHGTAPLPGEDGWYWLAFFQGQDGAIRKTLRSAPSVASDLLCDIDKLLPAIGLRLLLYAVRARWL